MFAAWFFRNFQINHIIWRLIILSHSWSPFFLLTYLYRENELLWGLVHPFGKKLLPDRIGVRTGTSATISRSTYVWWDDNQNKSAPNNIALSSHAALLLGNRLLIVNIWSGMTVSREHICNETLLQTYPCPI